MSYCKAFVIAALFALASCVDGSPSESQDPAADESSVTQSVLPSCAAGDPYYDFFELGPCGECKLANGHQGQILRHYIACQSNVQGTKILQGKFCSTCLTVPPPVD